MVICRESAVGIEMNVYFERLSRIVTPAHRIQLMISIGQKKSTDLRCVPVLFEVARDDEFSFFVTTSSVPIGTILRVKNFSFQFL